MEIIGRNVETPGGEIDLLMQDGSSRVAVEVRAITGEGDPIDAVGPAKRDHVTRISRGLAASRVDFLGVGFRSWGVEVHWLPG